jgi:hypothetical protein
MAVSSAKVLRIVLSDCGISAVYIVYNNGPTILPWGTPESIGYRGEVSLLYVVTKYLFCKYDFRRLKYTGGRVCLNFSKRPWCQILSNAWLTSKKMAEQYCWSSNALFSVSVKQWHCCIVECAFRKPNWCRGIHAWKCVSLYTLLSISFSKMLDVTGKRLIGLYEVTSVRFFPGFSIMMIFACFRGTGQYSNLVIALNMYRRVCRPSGGISCIIWTVMRSEPGALSGLSCLIGGEFKKLKHAVSNYNNISFAKTQELEASFIQRGRSITNTFISRSFSKQLFILLVYVPLCRYIQNTYLDI